MKQKILVIGAGSIGTRHIKNLVNLGFTDLIISDPQKDRLKYFTNFLVYENALSAIKKESPQIVFVCSPTNYHVSHCQMAISNNCDVFVEKPLSYDFKRVDGLIKKANNQKKIIMVACNWLFNKGFIRLNDVVLKNIYGKSILARVTLGYCLPGARKGANWKETYAAKLKGGGVILDSGSHVVNYLIALLGVVQKSTIYKSPFKNLKIESEEAGSLSLEHKNGVLSFATMDFLSRKPVHKIELITDKGLLTLDLREEILNFDDGIRKKIIYKGKNDIENMYIDELKHFFNCVNERKNPIQDLKDAKEVLKILLNEK